MKLPVTRFMEEMLYVLRFTFFSPPLIFTLVAASISHFLTAAIKFSCFSSNEIGLCCCCCCCCFIYLFLALALSLCSTLMQTLILVERKTRLCYCFFFSSKVRVTMRFTAEMRGVLERQIFTPANKREGSAIKVY